MNGRRRFPGGRGGAGRYGCLARLLGLRSSGGQPVPRASRLVVVVQSTVRPGEPLDGHVTAVDHFGRPATSFDGHLQLICVTADGRADRLSERTAAGPHLRLDGLVVEGAGVAWLLAADLVTGAAGMSNPFEVVDDGRPPIRWVAWRGTASADRPLCLEPTEGQERHLAWVRRVAGRPAGDDWLVGVLAESADREAVGEALRRGDCYVTTGRRILLRVGVDGGGMTAHVAGTGLLRAVEVLRDGQVLQSVEPAGLTATLHDALSAAEPAPGGPAGAAAKACRWVRVRQADGAMAWSSPTKGWNSAPAGV